MSLHKDGPKLTTACTNCRDRKVKCVDGIPCKDCRKRTKECIIPPSRRKKRISTPQRPTPIEDRLARMEALLQSAVTLSPHTLTTLPVVQSDKPDAEPLSVIATTATPSDTIPDTIASSREGFYTTNQPRRQEKHISSSANSLPKETYRNTSQTFALDHSNPFSDGLSHASQSPEQPRNTSTSYHENSNSLDNEEGVIQLQSVNWEHHGPSSWVSICSPPGLRWVCERIGTNDFIDSAKLLVHTWSSRLTINTHPIPAQRQPEPDPETAWAYTSAYFQYCYDAVFGIVHRPSFEVRLSKHLEQQKQQSPPEEDPAWYALRNVVYAAGCSCLLARDRQVSFVKAQAEAWSLFSNALAVFTDLLFKPSGLLAVQVLTLMTFYVEGLGTPALEYYLSTLAARMAQGKGLHRQPAKSWRLPESEILQRNWLWWAIYCLDKQVAFRSGRPSAIDDDNISAEIPKAAPPGSTIDVDVFTYIIKHAQISTQISRRIMSVRAFQQSLPNLINTVRDVHRQLEEFKQSLPPDFQIEEDVLPLQDRQSTSRLVHLVYIRFALYGSIMAVHIPFFYPWIADRLRTTETNAALDEQIALSSAAVAAAAPKIILTLRSLTIDVSVPAWLAFYYPMYAHINMFVQILKNPNATSAATDLALLDVCAGHFGHIDFVTSSEISFPFAKESASLAYKVVRAYAEANQHDSSGTAAANSKPSNGLLASEDCGDSRLIQTGFEQPLYFDSLTDNNFSFMEFNMDAWNMFSSVEDIDGFGNISDFRS